MVFLIFLNCFSMPGKSVNVTATPPTWTEALISIFLIKCEMKGDKMCLRVIKLHDFIASDPFSGRNRRRF